ncbi:MAG: TrkA family potassium uptake protein [Spirochaetia bacterium]|nr:TrkA family potassium uptake protein [Spirochaetia bacterium]
MIEKKPVVCLIGCGRTGGLLIDRLKDTWQLTVIDKNPLELKKLKAKYSDSDILFHEGDAVSYIELKKVDIEKAYQIIITVDKDAVSIEILKVLLNRFQKKNIICRLSDSNIAHQMRKKGVYVITPYETMANIIINQMNLGEVVALNIGKGEGEILQIELTKSSPIVGRVLRELPPKNWLIGAIYRPKKKLKYKTEMPYFQKFQISNEDELIIPSGDTVPKVGDKLILIGDPHILRSTAQYLKAGAPVFPVRHGELVVTFFHSKKIESEVFKEYMWLLENMEPARMLYFYNHDSISDFIKNIKLPKNWDDKTEARKEAYKIPLRKNLDYIKNLVKTERIGLIIYPEPSGWFEKRIHRYYLFSSLKKVLRKNSIPLWIIRNKAPIKKVTLMVAPHEGTLEAAELAIDAAMKFKLEFRAVQVNPPGLIAGNLQLESAKKMMQSVYEVAIMYGLSVQENVFTGNPVKEIIKWVSKDELLVLSLPKDSKSGVMIPNSAKLLAKKFPGSLLILAT